MVEINQDFWEFAFSQPWQEWLVSTLCLVIGALTNWVKNVYAPSSPEGISGNFITYYWVENRRKAATIFIALVVTEFGVMTSGASAGMTWPTFMYVAFSAGYLANSGSEIVTRKKKALE